MIMKQTKKERKKTYRVITNNSRKSSLLQSKAMVYETILIAVDVKIPKKRKII